MTLYENRPTAKSYSTVKPLQMARRIENLVLFDISFANRYSSNQYRVVLIVSVAAYIQSSIKSIKRFLIVNNTDDLILRAR